MSLLFYDSVDAPLDYVKNTKKADIAEGDVVCVRAIAGQRVGEHDRLVAIEKPHSRVTLSVPLNIVVAATDVAFPESKPLLPPLKPGDICVRERNSLPGWRFHVKTVDEDDTCHGIAIWPPEAFGKERVEPGSWRQDQLKKIA